MSIEYFFRCLRHHELVCIPQYSSLDPRPTGWVLSLRKKELADEAEETEVPQKSGDLNGRTPVRFKD